MIKRQRRKGFSLMELMVVLVIMGILAGVVTVQVLQNIDAAKEQSTRTQIAVFKKAIDLYKVHTNVYPEILDDLVTKPADLKGWIGPYLDPAVVPLDQWGNEYVYFPPDAGSREYVIMSYGADGEEGGEELNSDISNLNLVESATDNN